MKILIFRGGALGDFLVTVPALRLLREHWPGARIELVGNPTAGELAVRTGLLGAVHSQHAARWSALVQSEPLPSNLAAWLAEFDLIVNFWPDRDGAFAKHFPAHPGQQFLARPPVPNVDPAARHFCEALRPLGLETADFRCHLDLAPADGPKKVPGKDGPSIALHPGSGSARKNWPVERWLALVDRLDGPVRFVFGEAEDDGLRSQLNRLRQNGTRAISTADRLPLPELAACLAGCRLFLGHDSGVSHLAAAVGTPCVLLFGPTDPAVWAPPGDHVRVIRRGESLDAISVDDVLAVLRRVGIKAVADGNPAPR